MEWTRTACLASTDYPASTEYTLSDDSALVDVAAVHRLLSTSYWAPDRTAQVIRASIGPSLCFSLLHGSDQVGFGRFVTDGATFSWFCDFIIDPDHRADGLGKWMLGIMLDHPAVRDTSIYLGTRDAHELYRRYGFEDKEMMKRRAKEWRVEHG